MLTFENQKVVVVVVKHNLVESALFSSLLKNHP